MSCAHSLGKGRHRYGRATVPFRLPGPANPPTATVRYSITHHLCDATRETLKHTATGSAHASEPKSRRKVHDENVHEMELPKDPVIVVGGGELVARELAAREHHPAAKTTAAPSPSRSDRGRTWSTKQLLRVIKIDRVDVDRHPCASKQARMVRFARREHGWARARRRCKRARAGERFDVVFDGGSHLSGERSS